MDQAGRGFTVHKLIMKNSPFNFSERRIWIFGGAGHLGSPITTALNEAGAHTVCLDRPGLAAGLITRSHLDNTTAEECDLWDTPGIPALVQALTLKHGIPHGVVNLVTASSSGKSFEEISPEDFQMTCNGGLTSGFVLARCVALAMKAAAIQGSLVHFSSMYGLVAPDPGAYSAPHHPNPIDYGAVKAGLLQMSRYLAVYFAPEGIRSNCIVPGPFPQPNYQTSSPETAETLRRKVPMKRFGDAHEIAGPVLFLLSDAASYVTAQSLGVDGGWTAW